MPDIDRGTRSSIAELDSGSNDSLYRDLVYSRALERTSDSLLRECAELRSGLDAETDLAESTPPKSEPNLELPALTEDPRVKAILEQQKFAEEFNIPKLREMAENQEAYLRGLKQTAEEIGWFGRTFTDLQEINATQQTDAILSAREYSAHADKLEGRLKSAKALLDEGLSLEEQARKLTLAISQGSVNADMADVDQMFEQANELFKRSYEELDVSKVPDRSRAERAYQEISSELDDTIEGLEDSITWCKRAEMAGNIASNFVPIGKAAKGASFLATTGIGFVRSVAVSSAFNGSGEVGGLIAGTKTVDQALESFADKTVTAVKDAGISVAGGSVGHGLAGKLLGEGAEVAQTSRKIIGNLAVGAGESATKTVINSSIAYHEARLEFEESVSDLNLSAEEKELRFTQHLESKGISLGEFATDLLVDGTHGAVGKGVGLGQAKLDGKAQKEAAKALVKVGAEVTKKLVAAGVDEVKESI